jgi:hypothetical protein
MFDEIKKNENSESFTSAELLEVACGVKVQRKMNPFLNGLTINTVKKVADVLAVEDLTDSNGEKVGAELRLRHWVDAEKFVKVMSATYAVAFALGSAGKRMIWILLDAVSNETRKDVVYMSHQQLMTISGKPAKIGRTTYYEGLRQLKEAGFISEANGQGLYFINPELIFNGDRIRFVQEWIKTNPEQAGIGNVLPTVKQNKPEDKNPDLKRK